MNDWKSFYEKISDIKFTMLVTRDHNSEMHARPFTTQAAGKEGAVWFLSRTDSDAVKEIMHDGNVLLCYADTSQNRFISSAGHATLSQERADIDALWKPADKLFFPDGKDDPALVVVRVDISRADIWDSDKSRMEKLMIIAKAAAGLDADPRELGEHQILHK